MEPDQEQRLSRVQQSTKLNLAQRMADREQTIIAKLVSHYRAGKLDANALFGGIAAISELRAIASEAEHDTVLSEQYFENLSRN